MTVSRAHENSGSSSAGDGGSPGERAVSPVVGVALMIGLTVVVGVIVAPLVFAFSGDAGSSAPNPEFGFSYDEGVDPGVEDSFGNTSSDVRAAGLMTIVLEDGDGIEAGNLEIRGAASGGTLADATRYDADDPIIPGEEITVWANRGDDIQLVWNDAEEGSQILAEFAVRPTSDLPVFVPEPDVGCDWVEDRVPGDLNVPGVVVDCDLSKYSINDIDVTDGGAVISDVPVSGNVDLDDGTVYLGDVEPAGDMSMDNGAAVGGDIRMDDGSSSDLTVDDARIRGSVDVNGNVDAVGTTIQGSVDATGNLGLSNAVVEGTASATGTFTINNGSAVSGNALSDTAISMDGESEIEGDVDLPDIGSDLTCGDDDLSTINGIGCKEYKAASYTVTIDDTNQPVEGDQLLVNVTVENTGYKQGNPDVYLFIDGTEYHNWNPTIDGGNTSEQTLTWSTSSGDAGTHDAVVEVDDADGDLHDSETAEVLVADDSRSQNGLRFEIDGANSTTIRTGDTVPYTATALFDDSSTEDVTDGVNVSVVSGSASNITIDNASNEITGDAGGMLTLEANDSSGFTDTVDLTVNPPMADRTNNISSSTGTTATVTLENTGTDPVEIAEISVDSVNGGASKVDNDGDNESIQTDGPGYLDTQQIEIGGSARSFDSTPVIPGGDTSTFELVEFRNNGGNAKSVSDVDITLYFTDGTTRTYTLP